jgi:hypothetical protein
MPARSATWSSDDERIPGGPGAGQVVGLIEDVPSCAQRIMAEARDCLDRLDRLDKLDQA